MVLVRENATAEVPYRGEEAAEKKEANDKGAALNLPEEMPAESCGEPCYQVGFIRSAMILRTSLQ